MKDFLKQVAVFLKSVFSLRTWRERLPFAKPSADFLPPHSAAMPEPAPPFTGIVRQNEEHPSPAYMELKLIFRDIGRLGAVAETLGRDFLTAMPEGAWKSRLGQIAYLHRRMHLDLTAANVEGLLERAKSHEDSHAHDWDEWDRANLREMEKMILDHKALTPDLVEKQARLSYEGRRVHRDALSKGDWPMAREFLSDIVDLQRYIAEAKARANGHNALYQSLMNDYMPGLTVSDVEDWFTVLEKKLGPLLSSAIEKQAAEELPMPIADFYPAKAQMWLNRALLQAIGFDFFRGGLYETGHNPVEGGTPDDTRLVIKNVDTGNFMDSMKSALHEGGHGIYIQGLPRKTWRYQPVGQDMGAAVQESQALLIEMIMGRTRAFFEFLAPRVEGLFHGLHNPVLSPENLYRLKTRVGRSTLRKKADEVSYFFHIRHRFGLERDMIEGRLKPADLPDAWNEGMKAVLDVEPQGYEDGCLQDVHWFVGKFGYFPSYTVGHMLAAQLYDRLHKDVSDVPDLIRAGDFMPITQWLQKNIYSRGRLMDMDTLVGKATGAPLSPQYLFKHLESRYLNA